MKALRAFCHLLFGLGCAACFAGLLSLLLPGIQNTQFQLVLQSFALPSDRPVINVFNACVTFCFSHAWQVTAAGAAAALLGGGLVFWISRERKSVPSVEFDRLAAEKEEVFPFRPSRVSQPNPFAVSAAEEPAPEKRFAVFEPVASPAAEPSVSDFYKPLLEENRIEPEAASPFARPEPAKEPVLPPPESAPVQHDAGVLSAPKPIQASPPKAAVAENLSPRIRSTMGKKR